MSIKFENTEVVGFGPSIRGMRNPKNSWDRSDSMRCVDSCDNCDNFRVCNSNDSSYFNKFWEYNPHDVNYAIGPNDHQLMSDLAAGGPVHAKYRRMIVVYLDITAPLYWWKEFDTYKVGTVANSCSTMHKIHDKVFTLDDFSCEHLIHDDLDFYMNQLVELNEKEYRGLLNSPLDDLEYTISKLNAYRKLYLKTNDKRWWEQMIQLLPSSYNQKRTIMLNYEVLVGIYKWRKNHKLDEWREFCQWIESLPYSELITGREDNECEVE